MRIERTPRFKRAFKKLPKEIQYLFGDQIAQFEDDCRHPSLRVKHIEQSHGIWETSVNMAIRFTFQWITDSDGTKVCQLRNIGDHKEVLRPPY